MEKNKNFITTTYCIVDWVYVLTDKLQIKKGKIDSFQYKGGNEYYDIIIPDEYGNIEEQEILEDIEINKIRKI